MTRTPPAPAKSARRSGKTITASGQNKMGTLALPHERDESAERTGDQRAPIEQAQRDLAAGQVDTDNYTRATQVAGKKPRSV